MNTPLPADHLALLHLVATAARGMDRADQELLTSCYTDDSTDEHGAFHGSGAEFAEYICHQSPISSAARSLHHLMGGSTFEVEGDRARGETYYIVSMVRQDGGLMQGIGRYVDRFARVDGVWKIQQRRVVTEWTGDVAASESGAATRAQFAQPMRDRTDPSYDP